MSEKNGNYQIVLSTRLDTTKIKTDLSKLQNVKINVDVNITDKSVKNLQELSKALEGIKVTSKELASTGSIAKGTSEIKEIGVQSQKAAQHVKTFGEKAMEAFQKFSLWSVVSNVFYKIVRAAEGLVDTAIELDTAFTELSKVTDLTRDDFDKLTQQAYELGSEVAKTTTEVINAMTEFARAGYNVNESTDILAKNALMWTNIADGTVDASESANMMISVMKAFNVQAKNSTHIIDALNEVSNNYAISSGQLSNSLTKSSAVLANANVTFEEQLGLITAGTEILRNANTVSNGLRTISLRLQGMSEDEEKVDGLTASLEKDFNQLGLTLYEFGDQIKSPYKILQELAEIYPSLTAAQKAYYTELIAGKTRAQVAAAILNNFSTAINATETAYNSAGSAAKENAKVLESLNGHIQAFKAEWESLVNSKATQDTLKFFIDLGTTIIKLIKSVGGLGTALIQLGAVWTMLKFAKWGKTFIDVSNSLVGLSTALRRAEAAYVFAGGGVKGFSAALASSTTAMAAATAGLTLLIAGFGFIINKIQEAKQKHDEWIESTLSAADANSKNLDYLLKNIDKYKELASKIDKTETEEEEFKGIESEIISILGDKAKALDNLKSGTEDYTDAVEKLTEAEIANLTAQLYVTQGAAEDKLKSAGSTRTITNSNKDAAYQVLKKAGMAGEYSGYSETWSPDKMYLTATYESDRLLSWDKKITQLQHSINMYKDYSDALQVLNDEINRLNLNSQHEEASAIAKSGAYEKITEKLNDLKEYTEQWLKVEVSSLAIAQGGTNYLIDTQEEYDNLTNSIINNTAYTDVQRDLLLGLAHSTYPQFAESTEDLVEKIEESSNSISKMTATTQEELTTLKSLESAYSALSGALDEYNENGHLSAKTIDTLITEYGDYLEYLVDENGNLTLNEQAIQAVVNAKKEDIKATIIQEALNRIDSLKAETEEEKNLAAEIENETAKIKENNQARFEALALLPVEDLGANAEQIKNIIDDAQRRIALLNQLFVGAGSGGGSSGAKKTTDTWKEAFNKAFNDLENRRDRDIISTETYYKELKELNDKYFKDREEYADEYAKYEIKIYKGVQEVFKEQLKDMEHAITMLENQGADRETIIAKYKEVQDKLHEQAEYYRSLNLEGNKDLIDDLSEQWWEYQKKVDKLQKEISDDLEKRIDEQLDKLKNRFEALRDAALDAIDAQIQEKENWLEEQNALLDEQIDKYNEEKDTLEDQKEIEDKLLKIEEARKKLADAKNKKVRVYREGKGFVYENDFDAVNSAQNELNELLEDWQLFQEKARIQDIVSQLEAEKQANKDRVNKEIEDLNRLKDAWDKSLDLAQDVENYNGWLTKIENSENASFDKRLNLVKDFVRAYNSEMAQLQSSYPVQDSQATTSATSSANTASGNLKTYNGVTYNTEVDYQKLIDEAKDSGAPTDHLISLEKKRNAKIAGEGLTQYEPTYNYTSSSSSGSKSSSKSSSSSSSSKGSSSSGTLLSKVSSAISGIAKAITGYASGTENADGFMHLVGENGPELYIPPKGSTVVPNNLTDNILDWSKINPMSLVKSFAGVSGTTINVENISLPNVKDGESFVNELKNFKSFAIQRESNRL